MQNVKVCRNLDVLVESNICHKFNFCHITKDLVVITFISKKLLYWCAYSILVEDEAQSEGRVVSRKTLLPPASVGPSSPLVKKKKKKDLAEVMEEEAKKLLSYFNHRCVESLLRLTRSNLEMLRKRIEQPSVNHFSGALYNHVVFVAMV